MLPRIEGVSRTQRVGTAPAFSGRERHGERQEEQGSPRQKEDPLGIKACCHLFSATGMDLTVPSSPRARGRELLHSKAEREHQTRSHRPRTTQAARDGDEDLPAKAKKLSPLTVSKKTNKAFFLDAGVSLSQVGAFLDTRSVRKEPEKAKLSPRTLAKKGVPKTCGELSQGERFILKRCKDTLERRYMTLDAAFKKLETIQSGKMTLVDFIGAVSAFLRKSEAKIVYKLLDQNGDQMVTFDELQTILQSIH